jgi:hypothetical protein
MGSFGRSLAIGVVVSGAALLGIGTPSASANTCSSAYAPLDTSVEYERDVAGGQWYERQYQWNWSVYPGAGTPGWACLYYLTDWYAI